jgi:hypothetical protein
LCLSAFGIYMIDTGKVGFGFRLPSSVRLKSDIRLPVHKYNSSDNRTIYALPLPIAERNRYSS